MFVKTDPVRIKVMPDAVPLNRLTCRPVRKKLEREASEQIRELLEAGIIEEATEPSEWCAASTFIEKSGGGVRLVTDFRHLNRSVQRLGWPYPAADSVRRNTCPLSIGFWTMDMYKSYFQCRVDPRDQHYLTFVTPFGRFRYCRLPMGFADSSDQFLLATKNLCEGIPRVKKIMDDLLGEPSSLVEMASQLDEVC